MFEANQQADSPAQFYHEQADKACYSNHSEEEALAQGRRMLELLGRQDDPDSSVHLRAIHPVKGKAIPLTLAEFKSAFRLNKNGWNLYLAVNRGGTKDTDITECGDLITEYDDRPIEQQVEIWKEPLELPQPTFQVATGGISIHHHWVFNKTIKRQQWEPLEKRLLQHAAESDQSIGNASQVMALAGQIKWPKQKHVDAGLVKELGQPMGISSIINPSGKTYSAALFDELLPALQPKQKQPKQEPSDFIPKGFNEAGKNQFEPSSWEEIQKALTCISRRKSGQEDIDNGGPGAYNNYRNALWGSIKAAEVVGRTREEVIQLWQEHSPCDWEVEQVANSGGDQVEAGSFWFLARAHGYKAQPKEAKSEQQEHLTPAEKLDRLEKCAEDLKTSKAPYRHRLPRIRSLASDLGISMRDQELANMLNCAGKKRSASKFLRPGNPLTITPQRWLCDGLLLKGCLNLLVALPKQGKTSLLISLIAAWNRGSTYSGLPSTFLGRDLIGPCPKVLIIGTDQGLNDWAAMLKPAGLMTEDNVLLDPIIGLAHAGNPMHLDPEGIDTIAEEVKQYGNVLILVDSLAACLAPLGLKEESPEAALPLQELAEALDSTDATTVLIHHAAKGRATEGASSVSRGSTAIPALASQIIQLSPASNERNDDRKTLRTEGRGGQPLSLVIERDDAHWQTCGSTDDLERARQHEATIEKLSDRQQSALVVVEDQWEQGQTTTAKEVAQRLELNGADPEGKARECLKQLQRKGLVQGEFKNATQGKGGFWEFYPTTVTTEQLISRDRKQATVAAVAAVAPPSREDPGDIHSSVVITDETSTTLATGTTVGNFGSLEKPIREVTVANSADQDDTLQDVIDKPQRKTRPSLPPTNPIGRDAWESFGRSRLASDDESLKWDSGTEVREAFKLEDETRSPVDWDELL
ncbi:AAA family ATPase [Synechococcus sp. AH-603-L18]|nr:AAA family ATPase [Synechococcus sp. AH-603-L18]MDB4337955.1 AAA family ATPase [Synechococcus sp. AH-603-L18]